MTHRVVYTPEAEAQLVDLYNYISDQSSPSIALRFVSAITERCEKLTRHPRRGTLREDLRPGLRTMGFRRRVTIAFAVDESVVTIIAVLYGGRDISGLRQ